MLLASSGMLPDDLCILQKLRTFTLEIMSGAAGWLATCQPERAECTRSPNPAALLTRSRHWDDQFAVLLGHEVFGAAR